MINTPQDFQALISVVNDRLKEYLDNSFTGKGRVLHQIPADELAKKMKLRKWIKEGGLKIENLDEFLVPYLAHSQHMHHPHYIGHQVAVPHLASGVADFIQGTINNPMAIYEMGPSASVIEKTMINWMLSKIGWFDRGKLTDFSEYIGNGSGVFTHGGSMANLTALLAARAKISPDSWEDGTLSDLVIIAPEVSHYSIARSVSILGMGKSKIIEVPVDELERMKAELLPDIIDKTRESGMRIMAVVANACATSTGLYDPIKKIAEICREKGVWFHVDGAHGASALISDAEKHFMDGVELADSMIWDTHKMLRTTTLSAAVLFRETSSMLGAFQQKGSYLFHDKENLGFDLMPYTVECTKAAIATKLFWVLAAEGEKGLTDFVAGQYQITRTFYHVIQAQKDFMCPYFPEANILCFKYLSENTSNKFQLEIRNRLALEGQFYITSTEVQSVRYLRLTVLNPLTKESHILALLDEIRRLGNLITQG